MQLTQMKCVPCQGGVPPLSRAKAKQFLKKVKGWKLVENGKKIQKKFEFKDFVQAMKFITFVAYLAESEGHHPDICISWNKVTITNYTHKIKGLHENDFILAAKIDQVRV